MSGERTSLVEFYRRNGISPVRQDISDLEAHFSRRSGLYRQLGVLPSIIRGRSVIEIGPGSGFNSVFTATLEPSRYVLLEGNPAGVADIERLFSTFPVLRQRIEIVSALVEDYRSGERFDVVLCEGMLALAGVADPSALLRTVAGFVAPGGVLVITCIDAISDFAETLRRLCGQLLIDPAETLDAQAARLTPVFGPHLSTLPGMSRRHDDWVIDNLLNPASIGPYLSIPEAIAAIDGEFEFYAASPHYCTDWRWYKSLTPGATAYNARGSEQYWANAHNLLDCTWLGAPRDPGLNQALYRQCEAARDLIREYERRRDPAIVTAIRERIDAVERSVRVFSPAIADAIQEVSALVATVPPDAKAIAASPRFGPWFGRGQQDPELHPFLMMAIPDPAAAPFVPSLSVIVTAMNEEGNLRPSVESVLSVVSRQPFDYEVLIIDDGSTDRTPAIAAELAAANPRIKVHRHPRNLGLDRAYLKGIELATKANIGWVAGNNMIPSEALEQIYGSLGAADMILSYPEVDPRRKRRRWVSRTFTMTLNVVFNVRLRYYTGPCVYRADIAKTLKPITQGSMIVPELLLRLIKAGETYIELPLQPKPRTSGHTKTFRPRNVASVVLSVFRLFLDIQVLHRRRARRARPLAAAQPPLS